MRFGRTSARWVGLPAHDVSKDRQSCSSTWVPQDSSMRPPTLFNQAASSQVTPGRGELPVMRIILQIN